MPGMRLLTTDKIQCEIKMTEMKANKFSPVKFHTINPTTPEIASRCGHVLISLRVARLVNDIRLVLLADARY